MVPKKCHCCIPDAAPGTCWRPKMTRHSTAPRAKKQNRPEKNAMVNSVRSRLTLWYAAVLTCTLLLLSLVIYWMVKRSVTARTDAGLVELADSFLATLRAELQDET